MFYLRSLLLLMLLASCSADYSTDRSFLMEDDVSIFLVEIDRDTTLMTEQGTVLYVPAGTFTDGEEGVVKLEVTEALTKSAMIKQGLSTIAQDGSVLESGGMVKVVVSPEQDFNHQIQLQVPSGWINPGMEKFVGRSGGDGELRWEREDTLLNNGLLAFVQAGKVLYQENCEVCHDSDLTTGLTGPALGNVHLYRDRTWLVDFTLNSQKMIADGDAISSCLWDVWGPTVMNSFENVLSEKEIRSIYVYLENESVRLGLDSMAVEYVLACEERIVTDESYGQEVARDYVYYTNRDTVIKRYYDHGSDEILNSYLNYSFSIERAGWYNVDVFLREGTDDLIAVEKIELEVRARQKIDNLLAVLVYEERNIVVPFYRLGSSSFQLAYGKNFQLPKEAAKVIVIGRGGGKFAYGELSFIPTTTVQLELEIKTERKSQIDQYLEALDN